MNKALLLATATAILSATPAWAGPDVPEWQLVFETPKVDFYADLGSMQVRPDDSRLVWVLADSKDGVNSEGAHSNVSLQEYECGRGSFRYLLLASYSERMGAGEILHFEPYPPKDGHYIKGSPVKAEAICNHGP